MRISYKYFSSYNWRLILNHLLPKWPLLSVSGWEWTASIDNKNIKNWKVHSWFPNSLGKLTPSVMFPHTWAFQEGLAAWEQNVGTLSTYLKLLFVKHCHFGLAVNEGPFSFTLQISSKNLKESQSRIDSLLCTGGSNTISPSLLFYVGKICIF